MADLAAYAIDPLKLSAFKLLEHRYTLFDTSLLNEYNDCFLFINWRVTMPNVTLCLAQATVLTQQIVNASRTSQPLENLIAQGFDFNLLPSLQEFLVTQPTSEVSGYTFFDATPLFDNDSSEFNALIARAYRRLQLKFHPDRNMGNLQQATLVSVFVQSVFDLIDTEDKRRIHNARLNSEAIPTSVENAEFTEHRGSWRRPRRAEAMDEQAMDELIRKEKLTTVWSPGDATMRFSPLYYKDKGPASPWEPKNRAPQSLPPSYRGESENYDVWIKRAVRQFSNDIVRVELERSLEALTEFFKSGIFYLLHEQRSHYLDGRGKEDALDLYSEDGEQTYQENYLVHLDLYHIYIGHVEFNSLSLESQLAIIKNPENVKQLHSIRKCVSARPHLSFDTPWIITTALEQICELPDAMCKWLIQNASIFCGINGCYTWDPSPLKWMVDHGKMIAPLFATLNPFPIHEFQEYVSEKAVMEMVPPPDFSDNLAALFNQARVLPKKLFSLDTPMRTLIIQNGKSLASLLNYLGKSLHVFLNEYPKDRLKSMIIFAFNLQQLLQNNVYTIEELLGAEYCLFDKMLQSGATLVSFLDKMDSLRTKDPKMIELFYVLLKAPAVIRGKDYTNTVNALIELGIPTENQLKMLKEGSKGWGIFLNLEIVQILKISFMSTRNLVTLDATQNAEFIQSLFLMDLPPRVPAASYLERMRQIILVEKLPFEKVLQLKSADVLTPQRNVAHSRRFFSKDEAKNQPATQSELSMKV